jgi:hypothetical protein
VRATIAINRSFHLNNEWLHLSRTKQLLLRSLVELGFPDRVYLRDCLWRSTRQVNGLIFAAQVLSQLAGPEAGPIVFQVLLHRAVIECVIGAPQYRKTSHE